MSEPFRLDILNERTKSWGDPVETHNRIAFVWTGILLDKLKPGETVDALEVALCMSGMKLVRADISPEESDSLDDSDGYNEIARIIFENTKGE